MDRQKLLQMISSDHNGPYHDSYEDLLHAVYLLYKDNVVLEEDFIYACKYFIDAFKPFYVSKKKINNYFENRKINIQKLRLWFSMNK